MKKVTTLLTLCTMLCGSAFAQDNTSMKSTDSNANSMRDKNPPSCPKSCNFAWGTAITALTVIGVVVGLTASQATNSHNQH